MRPIRTAVVAMVCLGLLAGSTLDALGQSERDEPGTTAAETKANEAAYIEAFLAQDLVALMEAFGDAPVFEDQTFGDYLVGREAVSDMEQAVISMTDVSATRLLDHFVSADGSRGITSWQWIGSNFRGAPFDMPVMVVHEYVDDKIAKESLFYADRHAYAELVGD